jgi:hypothetical protein
MAIGQMPPAWAVQSAKTGVFSSQGLAICAARLFAVSVLRYGFRPSNMAFPSWHAWSDPDRGDWPPGFPPDKRPVDSLTEIRHWLAVFV